MFKRITLLILTNIGVMLTILVITNLLGLNRYMSAAGIDYATMFGFCLVYGMVGSFISLMMSKTMAKWMMGLQIIDPNTHDPILRKLVGMVHGFAQSAQLPKMPEVAIYNSPEINAFATGPSRSNSLVAVSSGLLNSMSRDEIEGVVGHEVAHIANGDMVTMTLIQGVMNAFVMFFAKAVAWAVANAMSRDEDSGPSYLVMMVVEMVLYVVFGLLAGLVIAWFSRQREFRADLGGAKLAGRNKMIAALQKLQSTIAVTDSTHQEMAAFKISGKKSFLELLSSHPPLEERIENLRAQV